MQFYKLSKNPSGSYSFIDKNTFAEGSILNSHIEGLSRIIEMLGQKNIDPVHGLELLRDVLATSLPIIDIKFQEEHVIQKYVEAMQDLSGLIRIIRGIYLLDEGGNKPYFWVCPGCKKHGTIFLPGKESPYLGFEFAGICSKSEAFEVVLECYADEEINLLEKEDLEIQIERSPLPDLSEEDTAILN